MRIFVVTQDVPDVIWMRVDIDTCYLVGSISDFFFGYCGVVRLRRRMRRLCRFFGSICSCTAGGDGVSGY